MRVFFTLVAILLQLRAAAAEDPASAVEFHQLRPVLQDGIIKVGFAVKNQTSDLIANVYVDCAALDDSGNVTDTGIANVSNLHAGEISHGFVNMTETSKIQNVRFECRVSEISE